MGMGLFLDASCYMAYERTPEEGVAEVEDWVNREALDEVVCESFHLYPAKAGEQSFSQMFTCEVIGALRWVCATAGVRFVTQPASIKKPTASICKARGIELRPGSQHVIDAQWHGWYRVWNPTRESGESWLS